MKRQFSLSLRENHVERAVSVQIARSPHPGDQVLDDTGPKDGEVDLHGQGTHPALPSTRQDAGRTDICDQIEIEIERFGEERPEEDPEEPRST